MTNPCNPYREEERLRDEPATPEYLGPVTIEVTLTYTNEITTAHACEDRDDAFALTENFIRGALTTMRCEVLDVKHIKED